MRFQGYPMEPGGSPNRLENAIRYPGAPHAYLVGLFLSPGLDRVPADAVVTAGTQTGSAQTAGFEIEGYMPLRVPEPNGGVVRPPYRLSSPTFSFACPS